MSNDYTIQKIYRYDVSYYAGDETEGLRYQAMIGLRNEQNRLIGVSYFHVDGRLASPGASKTEKGPIMMHFPLTAFSRIIDLLRNEKPVFLRHREGPPFVASIDTSSEPVGEGNE